MKRILLTMAAVSVCAAAAPAAAQYVRHDSYAADELLRDRAAQVQARIDEAGRSGALSPYQAANLRNQLWQFQRLERSYSRNGLSEWERSDLRTRLANIDRQVGGTYGRYRDDRYDLDNDGYDDRTDRDGNGYDDLLDSDGNGYDDRYDRNGDGIADMPYSGGGITPGDNPYGPDYGPTGGQYDDDGNGYEDDGDQPDDRGDDNAMLGDDHTSGDWDGSDQIVAGPDIGGSDSTGPSTSDYDDTGRGTGDLRVGAVAPTDLGAVPPQFRSLYPDGNGVYYRYEDGQILQIEKSTNIIRWIGQLYR